MTPGTEIGWCGSRLDGLDGVVMLAERRARLYNDIERLENGLTKLRETSKAVAALQDELTVQQKVVETKKKDADELLARVSKESAVGTLSLSHSSLIYWLGKEGRKDTKGRNPFTRCCCCGGTVNEESDKAAVEEEKCRIQAEEVGKQQADVRDFGSMCVCVLVCEEDC